MTSLPIDDLEHRTGRLVRRLGVLAGVGAGLILVVAVAYWRSGQGPAALTLATLAGVVGAFLLLTARHIQHATRALYEVGVHLRAETTTVRRRQTDLVERAAELRSRDHRLERTLTQLRVRLRLVELELEGRRGGPVADELGSGAESGHRSASAATDELAVTRLWPREQLLGQANGRRGAT